jgi:hypothetical protein
VKRGVFFLDGLRLLPPLVNLESCILVVRIPGVTLSDSIGSTRWVQSTRSTQEGVCPFGRDDNSFCRYDGQLAKFNIAASASRTWMAAVITACQPRRTIDYPVSCWRNFHSRDSGESFSPNVQFRVDIGQIASHPKSESWRGLHKRPSAL